MNYYIAIYNSLLLTGLQLLSGILLVPLYIIDDRMKTIITRINYNYIVTVTINIFAQVTVLFITNLFFINKIKTDDSTQSFLNFLLMFSTMDFGQVFIHKLLHLYSSKMHKIHHSIMANMMWPFDHFYSNLYDIVITTNLPVAVAFVINDGLNLDKFMKFGLIIITKAMNQHSGFFPSDAHYQHHEFKKISFGLGGIFDNIVS